MLKKSRVRAHGTQAGQQSKTETYKSIASYKTLDYVVGTKTDDSSYISIDIDQPTSIST